MKHFPTHTIVRSCVCDSRNLHRQQNVRTPTAPAADRGKMGVSISRDTKVAMVFHKTRSVETAGSRLYYAPFPIH